MFIFSKNETRAQLGLLYTDGLRRVEFDSNLIRLKELNSSKSKDSIVSLKENLLYTDEFRRIKCCT